MNPHQIESLARESLRVRLHRADVDRRLHAAGYRIVRPPFHLGPLIGSLLGRRRQDPCPPTSACCA